MNKAYPKYKSSGVEWLGDVPEHWEVLRFRHVITNGLSNGIFKKNDQFGEGTLLVNVLDVFTKDYKVAIDTLDRVQTDEVERKRYSANKGDVFFVRSSLKKEGIAKAVCMTSSKEPVVFECHLIKASPKKSILSSDFLIHYLNSIQINSRLINLSETTTMTTISQEKIASLEMLLPPLPEQQAIAAFLDRETGRIDALIAKKQRLLELLAEQRTALISRAVTKGLSGMVSRGDAEFAEWGEKSVHYKPSGVEWLGDVPEHWGVKKLKYVSNTNTGFAFSSDDYIDDGIPLIRIGDILQDGNVDIENAKKLPEEYLRTYRFVSVNKNDMLMAMTGATIGKAGRYQFDEKGLLNQRVCKFVPFKTTADFFWFILKSEQYAEHIKLTGFGGAQPNISDVQLLDFHFAFPPLPEQQAIAAFLDGETAKIDALSAKVTTVIERLKEYRTALISSAVTGKIDVREAV